MTEHPGADRPRATTRRELRRIVAGAVPRILTVCTGNICRSPLAALLLRDRLSDLGIEIASAGTHALVGRGMTPQARELAVRGGVAMEDAEAHRARYLVEPMLHEASLVLAMTREHRDVALQMTPGRLHQVVPVRELSRLAAAMPDEAIRVAADAAGSVPSDRLSAAVAAVTATRARAADADDDVIDPYRRSDAVYAQAARELAPGLAQVERIVRLALE